MKSKTSISVSGFSLIELLSVVTIISILSAIAFPVLIGAKREGNRATSLSNLRQCGIALLAYADEHDGIQNLPSFPAAEELLRRAPTCDPGDYFRSNCSATAFPPLIGSYAYARHEWTFADDADWSAYVELCRSAGFSPGLLINIFSSHKRHRPFRWFGEYYKNPVPDAIQVLEEDGGVRLVHPRVPANVGVTWATLFIYKK